MTAASHERHDGRRPWIFWPLALTGWALMVFAVRGLVGARDVTKPVAVARLLVGLDLVHDLVVVPAALLIAALVLRRTGRLRAPLTVGLILTAVAAAYAYPFVRGYGRAGSTPSRLPGNYAHGLLAVAVAIWVVVAVGTLTWRALHRRT
jgi:hypothetical protein